jgi:hypothetical protein
LRVTYRGPDRIEHLHIGLRNKAQRFGISGLGPCAETHPRQACRAGGDREFATCNSLSHPSSPSFGVGEPQDSKTGAAGRNSHRCVRSPPCENQLLDVTEPVLAEEDLVADEEGRRAEGAARDRALRIVQELRFDLRVLGQPFEPLGIETRFD